MSNSNEEDNKDLIELYFSKTDKRKKYPVNSFVSLVGFKE